MYHLRTCIALYFGQFWCTVQNFGKIWMQILWARLTWIHIEYLEVQHRRVISACTASEGDVWCALPLFCILSALDRSLVFYPHQGNPSTTTVCLLFRCSDESLIECSDIGGLDRDARWQNDDGIGFLVGSDWCHSVYLLALMWSALANSDWPTPCNLRCADLKNCFATSTVG